MNNFEEAFLYLSFSFSHYNLLLPLTLKGKYLSDTFSYYCESIAHNFQNFQNQSIMQHIIIKFKSIKVTGDIF